MSYTKILLALDLSANTHQLCDKALAIASTFQASLGLIHVVEPIAVEYAYDALPIVPVGADEELQKRASTELKKIADSLNIVADMCWTEVGGTKKQIVQVASENDFDLIIVGSHGRHGVALLLGSTANAVLHSAHCDVLAIRIS